MTDLQPIKKRGKKPTLREQVDVLDFELSRTKKLIEISEKMAAADTLDESLEEFLMIIQNEANAERATLFLNDDARGELYSRVLIGNYRREIRILNTDGLAGHVFQNQESLIVNNPYDDTRFDQTVDERTGLKTKSVLCVPIVVGERDCLGVAQVINNKDGGFVDEQREFLDLMANQAALVLKSLQIVQKMREKRKQEIAFLDVVADITSEIQLSSLLNKVMTEATRLLEADRGTLFLNDDKTDELYTEIGEGLGVKQIRLPNTSGIAGAVFSTGKSVNIPYAYADLRFNPAFDKQTGYFTRSILCVPVINNKGRVIGVTQILNKRGGAFTEEDEARLKAFTGQISIALENAKLFNDIQRMKNYNESMLESMSNAVLTVDTNQIIATCNRAGSKLFQLRRSEDLIGNSFADLFAEHDWLVEKVGKVLESGEPDVMVDIEMEWKGNSLSLNMTLSELCDAEGERIGALVMIEDVSREKRLKSTMSRYMDSGIAEQLLGQGSEVLGGRDLVATILFSDVRSFTTLTEELGAQGTVTMLNEYFTIMVDCIQAEGGMLDKFIGDAIMAGFGLPIAHDDDEDRAMRCAIAMQRELNLWNKEREKRGERPLQIGIGLNTDKVVAGNIGSPKRMDYTMIGDGVNLAARLESASKQYCAGLLISEFTRTRLKGTYRLREVDSVVVKGKTEPVKIHEVLDFYTDEEFPNVHDVLAGFQRARHHYLEQHWDDAISAFNDVLKLNPGDGLSKLYIERCELMKKSPPAADWDGVWTLTSK